MRVQLKDELQLLRQRGGEFKVRGRLGAAQHILEVAPSGRLVLYEIVAGRATAPTATGPALVGVPSSGSLGDGTATPAVQPATGTQSPVASTAEPPVSAESAVASTTFRCGAAAPRAPSRAFAHSHAHTRARTEGGAGGRQAAGGRVLH